MSKVSADLFTNQMYGVANKILTGELAPNVAKEYANTMGKALNAQIQAQKAYIAAGKKVILPFFKSV